MSTNKYFALMVLVLFSVSHSVRCAEHDLNGIEQRALIACPQTEEAWRSWAQSQTFEYIGSGMSIAVAVQSTRQIEQCRTDYRKFPNAIKCLKNFSKFMEATTRHLQPNHSFGLPIADDLYYQSAPYREMMDIPKSLKNAALYKLLEEAPPTVEGLESAIQWIQKIAPKTNDPKKQWQILPYESVHLATADMTESMGRLLIYIPGDNYDQFVQFGFQLNPTGQKAKQISLVSVQHTDSKTGKPLKEKMAYLIDHVRLRYDNIATSTPRHALMKKAENCGNCHKSAVLRIDPKPENFPAKYESTRNTINQIIDGFKDVKTLWNTEDYGPALGSTDPSFRTDEFLLHCSKGTLTDPARRAVVRKAMTCATCHDAGKVKTRLNFPMGLPPDTSSPNTRDLIESYVLKHKSMPKGLTTPSGEVLTLSDKERESLLECLRHEYFGDFQGKPGTLKTWLLNDACWAN